MTKKSKNDAQRLEELQVHNEAMKNHLQAALERIEKLTNENQALKTEKGTRNVLTKGATIDGSYSDEEGDEEDETENELEATI